MEDIASKVRGGVAFTGVMNGRIVYLKSSGRSVILVDKIVQFQPRDYKMRIALEGRLANERGWPRLSKADNR